MKPIMSHGEGKMKNELEDKFDAKEKEKQKKPFFKYSSCYKSDDEGSDKWGKH